MSVTFKNNFFSRIIENTRFGVLKPEENFIFNEKESRFELNVGGETCFLEALLTVDKMYLVHLCIPESVKRKGYDRKLVSFSLNWIKEKNLKIVPLCPYVAKYINKNPKFKFVLASRFIF